jgi:hypothetical protein
VALWRHVEQQSFGTGHTARTISAYLLPGVHARCSSSLSDCCRLPSRVRQGKLADRTPSHNLFTDAHKQLAELVSRPPFTPVLHAAISPIIVIARVLDEDSSDSTCDCSQGRSN